MKKKIPLSVLEQLEKYVQLRDDNFDVVRDDNVLLKVIDKDTNSDFYFLVHEYRTENGFKLQIEFKPTNHLNVEASTIWIAGKDLDGYFKVWTELLKRYNRIQTFYDDPIIENFTEDYYAEFDIVDEDLNLPLKLKQILLLDAYLESVENTIDNLSDDTNVKDVQDIKYEIINLRENLTSQSKAWVVKKLSMIWAKMTKQGTKFMKEFISEAKKKAIQEGIKFITEYGSDIIDNINK